MKHRLLPTFAIAVVAMAAWASLVLACDKDKTSSAQAASASMRSAQAAANWTAEQAAGCKTSKGASAVTA